MILFISRRRLLDQRSDLTFNALYVRRKWKPGNICRNYCHIAKFLCFFMLLAKSDSISKVCVKFACSWLWIFKVFLTIRHSLHLPEERILNQEIYLDKRILAKKLFKLWLTYGGVLRWRCQTDTFSFSIFLVMSIWSYKYFRIKYLIICKKQMVNHVELGILFLYRTKV